VKRAAVLANLRTAATSDTDDSSRQTARAALRGIHYGITGPVLQAQYSASLAALEGMTALAVHPRPPVWVHPIDGVSSWFALVLLGPGALVAQLTSRHLLAPDALPPNWAAHVGASDEVALPLSAPALDTRTGFLHWYVQTHWEAFTERPPTRLLQQLATSGNLRRDVGEASVCVLMHALRAPTMAVPAAILPPPRVR